MPLSAILETANVIEVENYSKLIEKFTDADGYFFPDELFEEQIQMLNIWHVKETGSFKLDEPGCMVKYFRPYQNIDTTKECAIKLIINDMTNTQVQFLLNNKLFICKELEYRITNDGIHPEVTGTFYEVK